MLKRFCFLMVLPIVLLGQGQKPAEVKLQDYRLIEVTKDVKVKDLFGFMDSIINSLPDSVSQIVTYQVLLWHNPWIMDSLVASDYYTQKAKGVFLYHQREYTVLPLGSQVHIPNREISNNIINRLQGVHIDINLPEFHLRIYEGDSLKYSFLIRVGRRESRYLQMTGRMTNLSTIPGTGRIVRIITNPDYYNPVTGHRYFTTTRDDGKVTSMPQIPWFETEINGVRNGQMIHPTTNPETLGRAYSNGCIGISEANAWRMYFYAGVGTPVRIRYDLYRIEREGDTVCILSRYL